MLAMESGMGASINDGMQIRGGGQGQYICDTKYKDVSKKVIFV